MRKLYDGTRDTGLTVRPDAFWPGMWRIHMPDGEVSDMVNISRATDAARGWLVSNSSRGNSRGMAWK